MKCQMKIKTNKINALNAIAYAIIYAFVYPNGYAKHMFIVYSLIVYLFIFNF